MDAGMNKGFTLLELMIVVAVVAILAAVAYPSYQEHVRSANREDAKQTLMQMAQKMEHVYATNLTYAGSNVTMPATAYTFSISNASSTAYTLLATPVATSTQAADRCGVLSISRDGTKAAKKGAVSVADCW